MPQLDGSNSMKNWFCLVRGKRHGPFTLDQLKHLIQQGKLAPTDLVQQDVGPQVPANTVPGLTGVKPKSASPSGGAPRPPSGGIVLRPPSSSQAVAQPSSSAIVAAPRPPSTAAALSAAPPSSDPFATGGSGVVAVSPQSSRPSLMQRLLTLPKPVLFGLCGAMGALASLVVLGELVLALTLPPDASLLPHVRVAVPDSMKVYLGHSNRFTVKIVRKNFKGPVEATIENPPAELRVKPALLAADADQGEIEVAAMPLGYPRPHALTVIVRASDAKQIPPERAPLRVEVEPYPAQLRLAVSPSVLVYQGTKNKFYVKVGRQGIDGVITLEASKVPPGLVLPKSMEISAGAADAEFDIEATPNAAVASHSLTFVARAASETGPQESSAIMQARVETLPAALQLAVSPKVAIFLGAHSKVLATIKRIHFNGDVKLKVSGLPKGVTARQLDIPAKAANHVIELEAADNLKAGVHNVTVEASANARGETLQTQAYFDLEVVPAKVPRVDVLFVLDLTGSMNFAIKGIQEGVRKFADHLESRNIDARIGMVCFRDIVADKQRPFMLKVNDQVFTTDYSNFAFEVSKLKATGGGDNPESSYQALALAAEQPYRKDTQRVLILVTDAAPKDHPMEKVRTLEQTMDVVKKAKVNQIHLVVGPRDAMTYKKFQEFAPGSYFDINTVLKGDLFAQMLPELGKEISRLTPAAPVLPKVDTTPPPLPPDPTKLGGAQTKPPVLPPASAVTLAPRTAAPVLGAVQTTQQYRRDDRWQLLFAIALWTALLAGGVAYLILAGQHYYLQRKLVSAGNGLKAFLGGFAAGMIGGAIGQLFFQLADGSAAWDVIGKMLGWSLLGGLIGGGMSLFIPNLKWWRGLAGGAAGGFLGAIAFLLVSFILSGFLGRLVGAVVLGFFIGLMVALAELAFRRWWLEVAFSPREIRTVTLGTAAVSIGGDESLASVFVQDAPPLALRYRVVGDAVLCEDPATGQAAPIQAGEKRHVGRVTITLCSPGSVASSGFHMQLSNGRTLQLAEGMPLTAEDLPGLEPQGADGVVAILSRRPNNPNVLMLRNRSKQTWKTLGAAGAGDVPPGLGVEVTAALEVVFGAVSGRIRTGT
jgi:Ca-activated chloride channel family protein